MRTREDVETYSRLYRDEVSQQMITVELLLDIRELLQVKK